MAQWKAILSQLPVTASLHPDGDLGHETSVFHAGIDEDGLVL